jgi:CRISPR-associated protein Csd1
MILQALYEYAKRKGDDLPEDGFENMELRFLIKICEDGSFVDLVPTGEEKQGKEYLIPQSIGRSGALSWQVPFLLWDNYGFVLAEPKHGKTSGDPEKEIQYAKRQNEAFIKRIQDLPEDVKADAGVAAVLLFYGDNRKNGIEKVRTARLWPVCQKIPGCNISFILQNDDCLIPQRNVIRDYQRNLTAKKLESADGDSDKTQMEGVCLVTGEKTQIARLHTATGILNGKSNAKLIGFQKNSGYDSYGKEQAFNAPVSLKVENAYTKALNYLIKSPANHLMLGNDTLVFWSEEQSKSYYFEDVFNGIFGNHKDNPDEGVKSVKALFKAVETGKYERPDSRFYVLCLSPNAARISVRFWETGTVKEYSERIKQYFEDIKIAHDPQAPEYLSLYQLLSAIALRAELKNLAPNVIGAVAESIIRGRMLPSSLQQQCVQRVRAGSKLNNKKREYVTRERAAILKAYINRYNRTYNPTEKEVSVSVDKSNMNPGYRLGCLFAVLEKVQIETHPNLNATITDRYYGAASTNPVTVFPQLLKLNKHHLSDEKSKGLQIVREKEIGEIIDGLTGFPAHLTLADQSLFAVGYYHERQSLFEYKDSKKAGEGEKNE